MSENTLSTQHGEQKNDTLERLRPIIAIVLSITSIIGVINFAFALKNDASYWHLFQDAFIASVLLGSTVYWLLQEKEPRSLNINHPTTTLTNPHRLNLSEQFTRWQLTPSESEIALLLLKGLSFDEIANIRQTKQKTVRQQATSIYKKAHVNGRHEFSAWFIEDLFPTGV